MSKKLDKVFQNSRPDPLYNGEISGIFTGLAGGLMALHLSGSYPDHAHWAKNAEPIFMIMVGGLKIFAGPILGSIIVTQLSAYLSSRSKG